MKIIIYKVNTPSAMILVAQATWPLSGHKIILRYHCNNINTKTSCHNNFLDSFVWWIIYENLKTKTSIKKKLLVCSNQYEFKYYLKKSINILAQEWKTLSLIISIVSTSPLYLSFSFSLSLSFFLSKVRLIPVIIVKYWNLKYKSNTL